MSTLHEHGVFMVILQRASLIEGFDDRMRTGEHSLGKISCVFADRARDKASGLTIGKA